MRFYPEYDAYVSWPVIFGAPLAYLAVVFALRRVMRSREAFELHLLLRVFNGVQIALSAVMAWQLGQNFSIWNPFMLNTEFTAFTEWWLFIHYVGKYVDMLESVLIVLRKRDAQLTGLHLYHHASVLMVWAWLLNIGLANGTAAYGAFVNSAVHALMYGHLYSNGDAKCMVVVLNKSSVTICQVAQFVSCMLHAVCGIVWDQTIPAWVCAVQLTYNILLVVLFARAAKHAKRMRLELQAALRERLVRAQQLKAQQQQQQLQCAAAGTPPTSEADAAVAGRQHHTKQE